MKTKPSRPAFRYCRSLGDVLNVLKTVIVIQISDIVYLIVVVDLKFQMFIVNFVDVYDLFIVTDYSNVIDLNDAIYIRNVRIIMLSLQVANDISYVVDAIDMITIIILGALCSTLNLSVTWLF